MLYFRSGCCLKYSTLQNFIPSTFTFSIEVGDWAALPVAQRMDGWVQVSNSGHTACNISFPPTKRNSKTKGNNCQMTARPGTRMEKTLSGPSAVPWSLSHKKDPGSRVANKSKGRREEKENHNGTWPEKRKGREEQIKSKGRTALS